MTIFYAAYDDQSIYSTGETPEDAIKFAREMVQNSDAEFEVAFISDELVQQIDENGWDGMNQSFHVVRGWIVETTDE